MGDRLLEGLKGLMAKHPIIGDVRGKGLFAGIEMREGSRHEGTRSPKPVANAMVGAAKQAGVLIGKTSRSFREFNNTLTLCPALIATEADIDEIVAGIDKAFTTVEQKFGLVRTEKPDAFIRRHRDFDSENRRQGKAALCPASAYEDFNNAEDTTMAFVHYTVKKIVHGLGAIKEAANEVKNLKGSKAFIVTDPGLAKIGVQKPLEEALTAGGIEWKLYAEAQLEPSMDSIQHCTDEAKAFGADVIIGFGGGSALDTTKAASVLLSNEGPIDKYFGINLVPNPSLPCILIPTTSGTGSEMTNISVLADTKNGGKGVVSEYMYADTVILDAELTFGLPPRVTAMTGVDAFVHAMESFCGIAATPITDALNLQAMKLVGANIRQAYANGKNAAARDAMMYASALAGMGFGNTQNGIIHAIGTTLPVECHIPHGLAMSFCAPFSVGFNYIANPEKYAIVADILRGDDRSGCMSVMDRAADVEDAFRDLLNDLDIATGLSNYGVKREDLPACADRAFAAKRLLNNNPRAASRDQILALLEANFEA